MLFYVLIATLYIEGEEYLTFGRFAPICHAAKEMLGLIHARFILTMNGLAMMVGL
jgi:hypothetical protein